MITLAQGFQIYLLQEKRSLKSPNRAIKLGKKIEYLSLLQTYINCGSEQTLESYHMYYVYSCLVIVIIPLQLVCKSFLWKLLSGNIIGKIKSMRYFSRIVSIRGSRPHHTAETESQKMIKLEHGGYILKMNMITSYR